MATESPIRMSETTGKWQSHKEAATFAPSSASMAVEELGMLLQGRGLQGSGRDAVPNRSGSAPPSMEGSFLSQQNYNLNASLASLSSAFQNFESEEQLRADPAYVAYYFSNVNQNPRLPLPLMSSENRRLVRHIGRNNLMLASVNDSGNDSLRLSHGTLSTHKEESEDDQSPQKPSDDRVDGTSGFWSGQDVASLRGQHKNVVDLIQVNFCFQHFIFSDEFIMTCIFYKFIVFDGKSKLEISLLPQPFIFFFPYGCKTLELCL